MHTLCDDPCVSSGKPRRCWGWAQPMCAHAGRVLKQPHNAQRPGAAGRAPQRAGSRGERHRRPGQPGAARHRHRAGRPDRGRRRVRGAGGPGAPAPRHAACRPEAADVRSGEHVRHRMGEEPSEAELSCNSGVDAASHGCGSCRRPRALPRGQQQLARLLRMGVRIPIGLSTQCLSVRRPLCPVKHCASKLQAALCIKGLAASSHAPAGQGRAQATGRP